MVAAVRGAGNATRGRRRAAEEKARARNWPGSRIAFGRGTARAHLAPQGGGCAPRSRNGVQTGLAQQRRPVLQKVSSRRSRSRASLPRTRSSSLKKTSGILLRLNALLSFLVHYCNCPTSGHRVAPVHSV